jgi:hypothetical protein
MPAFLYDYRQFNQLCEVNDNEAFAAACEQTKTRKHSIVVEQGDDYYRVTPKGRKMSMPSWFMPATLGGKP